MFCSPALATAIDRAEGRFCAAIAQAAPGVADGADLLLAPVGGGLAVFAATDSPMNKIIGAGFDGLVDDAELDRVERHFAARGARLQAEVATLADPALHRQLCARGYAPSGFENVLGHSLTTVIETPSEIAVQRAEPAEIPDLADVFAEAFANPDVGGVGGDTVPPSDELKHWFTTTSRVDGYRAYVARLEGVIAGAAALRIDGTIAQFSGAGTRPGYRRRGVQSALLRARLRDAAAAGCTVGVVVTQPASQSQQNVQREGFALLYARQLLVKPAPGA